MKIIADKIGFTEFQKSFTQYITPFLPEPTLFNQKTWTHSFEDSKQTQLIQISDVIAGTIMNHFDPDRKTDDTSVHYNIIKPQILHLEFFPYKLTSSISENLDDNTILEYQRVICDRYLQEYSQSIDDDTKLRVSLLKQLMIYTYNDKTVFAKQLRQDLDNIEYEVSDRKLKTELIGKLRSYGIIISGTKSGYCLATKKEHVVNYIAHDESIIFPMLEKLLSAQQGIEKASEGSIKLLDSNFKLSKILQTYKE
ncbi:MAG: hypothetical protein ACRCTQ_06465 [Brevinemataceae bacterium]